MSKQRGHFERKLIAMIASILLVIAFAPALAFADSEDVLIVDHDPYKHAKDSYVRQAWGPNTVLIHCEWEYQFPASFASKQICQFHEWPLIVMSRPDDYYGNTSKTIYFNIITADLDDATIKAVDDQVYTGSAITPALGISLGAENLVEGRDFNVTWKNNVNVGEATGTIEGIEPYCAGTRTVKFKVTPKPVTVTANNLGKTFGDPEPKLTATVEGTVGSDTVAYSLSRKTGQDAGTYAITASGEASQGNYSVTFKGGTFTIEPASVADAEVAHVDDVTFDGAAFEPDPEVTWKGKTLERDKDYTLLYVGNQHAGQATVTVKGIGNFKEGQGVHFEIAPLDLSSDGCEVFVPLQVHTGSALEPHPRRVTAPGRDGALLVLVEDVDYEIRDGAWTDNVDVGTGHVVVNGIGDFCGSRTGDFNIVNDGDLSQGSMDDIPDQVYTGGHIEPVLHVYLKGKSTLLRRDVDYKARFQNNENVGTARVFVEGIAPLSGSQQATFEIKHADIGEAVVAAADATYDGTAQEPEPTVTWNEMLLIEGTHYEVIKYEGNVHAGTATVTVKGRGNFEGEASGEFEISQRPLTVTADSAERAYTGGPLVADGFTSEGLAEGDAVVSATVAGAQTDVGSSPSTVSDAKVENAAGEDVTSDYDISYEDGMLTVTLASIADAVVAASDQTFTGGPLEPSPTVTWNEMLLAEGTDYEITGYEDNVHAGPAKVNVKGKGNFEGTTTGSFQIAPARLAETVVAASDQTFTGGPLEPSPTVTWNEMLLVEGTDYEVSGYSDNMHAGPAKVTVKGKGDFEGSATGAFEISPASISEAVVAVADQVYDGTELEPSPTVTWNEMLLVEGSDYEITGYEGNVHAGTAKAAVKGIGDFEGVATGAFEILPASIASAVVAVADQVYDGTELEPSPTVTWNEMLLVEGTDYEVAGYEDNVHAGKAVATVKGICDFEGEAIGTFQISQRPLTVTADSAVRAYTGGPLTVDGFTSEGLAEGDFVVSADVAGSQTDVGSSANVASGAKVANAGGEDVTADYDIAYADGTLTVEPLLDEVVVSVTGRLATVVYDGAEHAVEGYDVSIGNALYTESDFSFAGEARAAGIDAGVYSMNLVARDFTNENANFANVVFEVENGALTVEPASLDDSVRFEVAPIPAVSYDGTAQEPKPIVRDVATVSVLKEGVDYTLAYRDNIEIGTAVVTISGKGNYTDAVSATFEIVAHAVAYTLIRGPEGAIAPNTDQAVEFEFVRSEDDEHTLEHFASVSVDGRTLGDSEYSVRRGSAIVTFAGAFLKTLALGEHVLTASFDDGETSVVFTIAKPEPGPEPPAPTPDPVVPSTGDGNLLLGLILALIASGAGCLALYARNQRRNRLF